MRMASHQLINKTINTQIMFQFNFASNWSHARNTSMHMRNAHKHDTNKHQSAPVYTLTLAWFWTSWKEKKIRKNRHFIVCFFFNFRVNTVFTLCLRVPDIATHSHAYTALKQIKVRPSIWLDTYLAMILALMFLCWRFCCCLLRHHVMNYSLASTLLPMLGWAKLSVKLFILEHKYTKRFFVNIFVRRKLSIMKMYRYSLAIVWFS